VRDFDRSVAFYTDVLGFTKKIEWGQKPGRAVMLDTGDGNYFELFERPKPAAGQRGRRAAAHRASHRQLRRSPGASPRRGM
jgi:catechol 2,3-dioxygenase-like lactoylglutathione lyase family enzyme